MLQFAPSLLIPVVFLANGIVAQITCPIPVVSNSTTLFPSQPNNGTLQPGDNFVIQCNQGFMPGGSGLVEAICTSDGTTRPTLLCIPDPTWLCGTPAYLYSRMSPRIFDGTIPSRNEYPWTAYVDVHSIDGSRFVCGGALLRREWVLTSAQCLAGRNPAMVLVGMGRQNMSELYEAGEQWRVGFNWTVHPSYDGATFNNDFALVKMSSPFNPSMSVRSICLPTTEMCNQGYIQNSYDSCINNKYGPNRVIAAGWGRFDRVQSRTLPQLKSANQTLYHPDDCAFKAETDSKICGGSPEDVQDTCEDDLGGPLMCYKGDVVYLLGTVSHGKKPCGNPSNPRVFGRVCKVLNWIETTIA